MPTAPEQPVIVKILPKILLVREPKLFAKTQFMTNHAKERKYSVFKIPFLTNVMVPEHIVSKNLKTPIAQITLTKNVPITLIRLSMIYVKKKEVPIVGIFVKNTMTSSAFVILAIQMIRVI